MIPKYVYDDLKAQAEKKLDEAKENVINKYRPELESITKEILNKEIKSGYVKIEPEIHVRKSYHSNYVEIIKGYDLNHKNVSENTNQDIKKKTQPILDKINKKFEEFGKQFTQWQMDIFVKASEGQPITLPDFKID